MDSSIQSDSEKLLGNEEAIDEGFVDYYLRPKGKLAQLKFLSPKLVLSIICNVLLVAVLISWNIKTPKEDLATIPTLYANLARDIPRAWTWNSKFFNDNLTAVFEAWRGVNHDPGVIVLPDTYVREKELPISQRFEWDNTKGVYLVNGYHNLHCLKIIAHTMDDLRLGRPLYIPLEHSVHCLDALRQDVLCEADDTPRWSGSGNQMSGIGQVRQCRDWSKLEDWAKSYTACHRHIHLSHGDDVLERFKFCSKDSPYAAKIKEYFPDIELD